MPEIITARLLDTLSRTVGPAPWYWKTFPALTAGGRRLQWTHHGDQGALGYLVSLAVEQDSDNPLIALNTYCRAFPVPQGLLGVWCPEGRNLRVTCFDPEQLKPFDFAEIAGWFKQSSERMYAGTAPVADFDIPLSLGEGTHKIEVPRELHQLEELILPASYPAKTPDDPAFALYVLYPHAGLVEVLPQKWFTAAQYDVGRKWIPRAARDPESHRIFGECFGVGSFLLEEDGMRLERWLEKKN
jgi:hypothetical protein